MKKKRLLITAAIISIFTIIAYNYYAKIFSSKITKDGVIYITKTSSLDDINNTLQNYSTDKSGFLWVAHKKNVTAFKAGRYLIKIGMSNNDLVNMFRSGRQTPVKISFNNQDTLDKFTERIAEQLQLSKTELYNAFTDINFLKKHKLTKTSVLQICIPNTYEFYWTVSAKKFRQKMLNNYNSFWTDARREKAQNLGLTIEEVSILASIVQKETAQKKERPVVAGLYLNRLKIGMPLQADPTVIYSIKALKGPDVVVKRVLTADLKIKSPYNTYLNRGLPPSLIAMPDISAIDGVLNATKHNYLYMCASVTKIGFHEFATTLSQHNRNARKYQAWLSKRGINR